METSEIEKASLDDIIFEGRNKAYGAYLLRKLYNRHLAIATALAISLFAVFLSVPLIANLSGNEIVIEVPAKKTNGHVITEVILPPKPEPPAVQPAGPSVPPAAPKVKAATKRYVPYTVQPDESVTEPNSNPTTEELKNIEIGPSTEPGDPDGLPTFIEEPGSGSGVGSGAGGTGLGTEPFLAVEEMPRFNGSMAAFLQKNIRYPEEAKRLGVEGLVVLTFTVSPTGEISNIEVVKSLGAGLDEEAIRVTKLMPPWQPGKQNGQAVPVKFTLPFRFAIR